VITVGGLKGAEEAGWIADGAAAAGVTVIRTVDNVEARIVLDKLLAPGDTVLFKASQPAGLQPLAEQLAGQAETVH
jgi:UDP-N-acetylmuramyl pentapeptide synthase